MSIEENKRIAEQDMLCVGPKPVEKKLGYMPVDTQRGNLFFQLVSRRYEKGSIILSTNKPFDRWGEIFGDDVIASAILDRLLHHCHIIPTSGPSDQIKDKLEKLKSKELNKMAKVW